jgi:hypothetical protein
MPKNIQQIADLLGADTVGSVPETGGGAFGAARLAAVVAQLRARLVPGNGKRPGRPTNPQWVRHPKVPMTEATRQQLIALARKLSGPGRKVSPMQLAAQILEETVSQLSEDEKAG